MKKREKSLSVRFLVWWLFAIGVVIGICAVTFYSWESRSEQQLLKQQTNTLAAVMAPRVSHDLENHVASYAHRSLQSIQGTQRDVSLCIYGEGGGMLFSTNPVFRRSKEIPAEVSQVLADGQPRWVYVPGDDHCQAFYPMLGHAKAIGVIQITRSARDLFLLPMLKTAVLVILLSVIAVIASGLLLLFMNKRYFKPLKELSGMLETMQRPMHPATVLEIPESEFHGELASLYRNVSELAKNLAQTKRSLESRTEVRGAVEKIQEENRFLARQIYERKIDRLDIFSGYEILSKLVQVEQWGRLWKNSVAQDARKVVFSFWNSKNDGLKGVLQATQWDEIFQTLVSAGKSLEEISDELFMEFGLDLTEWLLGRWDAGEGRLELMGNAWACHWDHAKESFFFLQDAKPLTGNRKQGFWVHRAFSPSDKLVIFNRDAVEAPGGAGLEMFMGLLSKNIKSSGQNLMDILVREIGDGKHLVQGNGLLLMIHCASQTGANDLSGVSKKEILSASPPSPLAQDVIP